MLDFRTFVATLLNAFHIILGGFCSISRFSLLAVLSLTVFQGQRVSAQSVQQSELTFPMSQLESRATMKLLSNKDGLSQSSVVDLLQDKNGFIWASTGDGLVKYDGYTFTSYRHNPDNPNSISQLAKGGIIHEDSRGRIWTQALDELDPVTGIVIRHVVDSTRDILGGGPARSFLNDNEGNLWIVKGTRILTFDVKARMFSNVVLDPLDPSSSNEFRAIKLLLGKAETLWIAASNNRSGFHLFHMNTVNRQSKRILFPGEEDPSASQGQINAWNWNGLELSWFVDKNNHLWVSTWKGGSSDLFILQFDPEGVLLNSYPIEDSRSPYLDERAGQIANFFELLDGSLWCVDMTNGFLQFNKESNAWRRYYVVIRSPLWNDFIVGPIVDKTGQVLFRRARGYTDGKTLRTYSHERFDPKTGMFSDIKSNHGALNVKSDDSLPKVLIDPDGQYWFESDRQGMDRYDPETKKITQYLPKPGDVNSFTEGRFLTSLIDRSGGFWISQQGAGLFKVDTQPKPFYTITNQSEGSFDIGAAVIRGMHEARDGTLWVASQAGLHKWNKNTSTFTNFVHQPNYTRFAAGPIPIGTIAEDDFGNLILGGAMGAYRFNPKTEIFSFIPMFPKKEANDNYVSIHKIKRKPDGTFGFATADNGYLEMNAELTAVTFSTADSAFSGSPLRINTFDFSVDSDGSIWLAPMSGLVHVDADKNILFYYDREKIDQNGSTLNIINYLLPDPTNSNILWLATRGGGLAKWNKTAGTFSSFTESNSDIPNNVVYGLLPDDIGNLWLSTNNGLGRFNPANESFSQFGEEDGLQDQEFNINAFLKMSDDALVFGGIKGISVFYSSEVTEDANAPQISISKLVIYNPSADSSRSYNGIDPSMKEMTVLSHAENDLTFSFAALHFQSPEKNQYSYKLDGYEPTFSKPATTRTVRYSNLPPGEYVFRIEASNSDGAWTENGYSFAFEILPPWWRTVWAYLVYGALFVGGVYQVDRFQRRRLNRKQEEQARIDRAELEAEKASAHAKVLLAENEVKELELKKAKELEYAFSALQKAHDDLKTTQDQLIHSEKMASLGALTAGIAHEIKNPLNFINNFAEINAELADDLIEALPPSAQTEELRSILDSLRENSAVIGKHGKRADSIVRNMLQHARGSAGEMESVDLNRLIGEYIDLAFHGKRSQMTDFQSDIKRSFATDLGQVSVVPQEFSRVVLNLLSNAFDAVQERAQSESGAFAPLVEVQTSRVGSQVEIRVMDNGSGIKAENLDEVFKPFFTTKPTGAGTGLGLSMSYDIVVKAHNGTMRVESNENGGATFIVTVPG
ncbi:ATP-binding protein [bacterium]|nr:ATP-binding protein [bacterium]